MKAVRYITDQGHFFALIEEGRSKVHVSMIGYRQGVTVQHLPLSETRYMTDFDYPTKKAARKFLQAGRSLGITKGARKFLKGAWG